GHQQVGGRVPRIARHRGAKPGGDGRGEQQRSGAVGPGHSVPARPQGRLQGRRRGVPRLRQLVDREHRGVPGARGRKAGADDEQHDRVARAEEAWRARERAGIRPPAARHARAPGGARQGGVRLRFLTALLAALALVAAAQALAQDGTVKIQVPFAPGGGTDILTRIIAPRLAERLAQPVIVENRPGAGGATTARHAAAAAPDGQTIMMGTISEIAINPNLNPKIGYDIWRDFALVGSVAYAPITVVVHPSVPAKSVQELIALARAKPKLLNYGSAGTGSGSHMGAELFSYLARVEMTPVPYKSVGPAIADTVAGQIQLTFTTVPSVVNFVRSAQLRALGVASERRAPQLSDVPTFIEAGMPEYLMDYWYCLVAPAATPKEIQARLNGAARDVMRMPEVAASLDKSGLLPLVMTT